MKSDENGQLEVQWAKTASQLKRNAALARACDLVKKDARANGKVVEIAWKKTGTKDRAVEMAGAQVFLQTSADLVGTFCSPFQDLVL